MPNKDSQKHEQSRLEAYGQMAIDLNTAISLLHRWRDTHSCDTGYRCKLCQATEALLDGGAFTADIPPTEPIRYKHT